SKAPPRAQLQLEHLEDRKLLAVSFHGGPVIPHVKVENLYLGSDWASSANQLNMQQLNQSTIALTYSSYMSMLGEYGVGKGSFAKSDPVYGQLQGSTVSETAIQSVLRTQIQLGFLDESDGSHFYVVYLPPNVHSQLDQQLGALGHHNSFDMLFWQGLWNYSVDHVYYAVIPSPVGNPQGTSISGYSTFQQQTEIASHEIAEGVTDPQVWMDTSGNWHGTGWHDGSNGNSLGQEIGDLVNQQVGTLNGYLVQREWSNYFNRGILPQWDTAYLGTSSTFPIYTGTVDTFPISFNEPGFGTRHGYCNISL